MKTRNKCFSFILFNLMYKRHNKENGGTSERVGEINACLGNKIENELKKPIRRKRKEKNEKKNNYHYRKKLNK